MKKSLPTSHRVRIIAGYWRSRLVEIVDVPGLRPTTDRVRETVFNWLNPYIEQARVIDLFAGTGILGLEACSRGAKEIHFIEKNAIVFKALKENLVRLQPSPPSSHVKLTHLNAIEWLRAQDEIEADIIFIDPPFDQIDLLEQSLQLIVSKIKRNNVPIIYVESSSKLDNERFLQCLHGWVVEKELVAGAVRANLLRLDKQ